MTERCRCESVAEDVEDVGVGGAMRWRFVWFEMAILVVWEKEGRWMVGVLGIPSSESSFGGSGTFV